MPKRRKCQYLNCSKIPHFNFKGETIGLFCCTHKIKDMIDVIHKKCIFPNCNKIPIFNFDGEKKGIKCLAHKDKDMVNIKKRCCYKGCNRIAYYNTSVDSGTKFCRIHKEDKMINKNITKCNAEGCYKLAQYNYAEKSALYCNIHKSFDMINVRNKKCYYDGCTITPVFNFKGKTTGLYCYTHKKDGMINVVDRSCIELNCNNTPSFNYSNKRALYCSVHKKKDMIDVKKPRCIKCNNIGRYISLDNKRYCIIHKTDTCKYNYIKYCTYNNCNSMASYNYLHGNTPIFCAKHKDDDMIDLVHKKCTFPKCKKLPSYYNNIDKRCVHHKYDGMKSMHPICVQDNCNIRASYNYPHFKIPTHCVKHKLESMEDVIHPKCNFIDCNTRVYYGYPGMPATRCSSHKLENMIRYPRKKCNKCKNPAIYGISGQIHCEVHKESNEINLIEKQCTKCNLLSVLNFDGLCNYCDEYGTSQYTKKQRDVKNFLDLNDYMYISYDKVINKGICGKERPDFVFKNKNGIIIILEVDENQHKSYNSTCDINRMINIGQSFEGSPTIFIRFNPDSYKLNGIGRNTSINSRYKKLSEVLDNILKINLNELRGFTSYFTMYYDGKSIISDIIVLVDF